MLSIAPVIVTQRFLMTSRLNDLITILKTLSKVTSLQACNQNLPAIEARTILGVISDSYAIDFSDLILILLKLL
jgi:hypothetical protein